MPFQLKTRPSHFGAGNKANNHVLCPPGGSFAHTGHALAAGTQELKGNIRVFVRLRPPSDGAPSCLTVDQTLGRVAAANGHTYEARPRPQRAMPPRLVYETRPRCARRHVAHV